MTKLIGYQEEFQKIRQLISEYPEPLLLSGEPHKGKTTLALTVIQSLFCEYSNACGECKSCKRFLNQNEVDFLFIDSESNTLKLEDVTLIKEFCLSRSMHNRHKYILIKNIERFNDVSQNALLKTIEEPVDFVKFIFTSSYSSKLLPTIKSRCIELPIYSIERENLLEYLYESTSKEKAEVIQHFCHSIYDVNVILDESSSFFTIRNKLMSYLLEIKNKELFYLFTDGEVIQHIENVDIFYNTLHKILMDIMYVHLGMHKLIVNVDSITNIEVISGYIDQDNLIHCIEDISKLYSYSRTNVKKELVLNNLMLTLIKYFKNRY